MLERELTEKVIGAAIEVHKHWGPGLFEGVYEKSLCRELQLRGLSVESQVEIPLIYKGEPVGDSLRMDLFVEKKLVVELKSVAALEPIHDAQLLTYMKLVHCKVGLLINFNVTVLTHGVKRMVL